MKQITYIDLFAGAGGLSEGFMREGYKSLAHVEMNRDAADTLKTRVAFHYLKQKNELDPYIKYLKKEITRDEFWSHIPDKEIQTVINSEIKEENIEKIFRLVDSNVGSEDVDVIVGGPPCQAYSVIGRARDPNNMLDDPRNHLYKLYIKFLDKYKPKVFVFENVPGILSAKNGEYFGLIKNAIDDAGYNFEYKILNAKDFGVLQNRKRIILLGWRKELSFSYPIFDSVSGEYNIGSHLFSDLPYLSPGEGYTTTSYTSNANDYLIKFEIRGVLDFTTQHVARPNNDRDLEIYQRVIKSWIHDNKRLSYADLPRELQTHRNTTSFLNRFQVVNPFGLSHTVVAHISCDGHYYIYPDLNQVRSISLREAARIQSFPDDYFFEGSRTAAFKQVGNAVPPIMAQGIARKIKKQLLLE